MQMETDSHPSSDSRDVDGASPGCGGTSSTPRQRPQSLMP